MNSLSLFNQTIKHQRDWNSQSSGLRVRCLVHWWAAWVKNRYILEVFLQSALTSFHYFCRSCVYTVCWIRGLTKPFWKWINKQRSCLWEKHLRISVFLPRLEAPQISQRERAARMLQTRTKQSCIYLFIYLFATKKQQIKNISLLYIHLQWTLWSWLSVKVNVSISVSQRELCGPSPLVEQSNYGIMSSQADMFIYCSQREQSHKKVLPFPNPFEPKVTLLLSSQTPPSRSEADWLRPAHKESEVEEMKVSQKLQLAQNSRLDSKQMLNT